MTVSAALAFGMALIVLLRCVYLSIKQSRLKRILYISSKTVDTESITAKDLKTSRDGGWRRDFVVGLTYLSVGLFLLFWLPLIGPWLAGLVGGRRCRRMSSAIIAAQSLLFYLATWSLILRICWLACL